jgi:hypothetical protein
MKINIETIPHDQQRYETPGDYWVGKDDSIQIRVSKMGDHNSAVAGDYEFLVALHELIEVHLCKKAGISLKIIDNFDKDYEQLRKPEDESEPGDATNCPYKKQHLIATGIEKIVAAELGIDWKTYDKTVTSL